MKNKYGDYNLILFLSLIVLLFELFIFVYLFSIKIRTFKVFDGVVYKSECIQLVVTDSDLDIIYSNKTLYYKNHKKYYEIISVNREIINDYNLVTLKFGFNRKINDVVSISIFDEKISFIEMFKIIWKE